MAMNHPVRRLFPCLVLIVAVVGTAHAANDDQALVPKIDDAGWWPIAANPDLGALKGPEQQPVDFGVWQAADGSWQLWSCIRSTKEEGRTRLFYRWEGKRLVEHNWKPKGIAMRADSAFRETPGGLQAPFVVRISNKFLMFYGDWENICVAASDDGKQFDRVAIDINGPQVFGEGAGNNARDPMLINVDGIWHCYYSAMRADVGPRSRGGIFLRTSSNPLDWSSSRPKKVLSGGSPGNRWYQAECPHVVLHKGFFYCFRTSQYVNEPTTTVYRSKDPTAFGIDDDSKIVAAFPIAAPEILSLNGQHWIAALNPGLDGVRVTRLDFVTEPSP